MHDSWHQHDRFLEIIILLRHKIPFLTDLFTQGSRNFFVFLSTLIFVLFYYGRMRFLSSATKLDTFFTFWPKVLQPIAKRIKDGVTIDINVSWVDEPKART